MKKGLLYSPGQDVPITPSPDQVRAYEEDGDGGPALPDILIDWDSLLKASS